MGKERMKDMYNPEFDYEYEEKLSQPFYYNALNFIRSLGETLKNTFKVSKKNKLENNLN